MSDYKDYNFRSAFAGQHLQYLLPGITAMLGVPKGLTILDIGCGNGALAKLLLEKGYNIYGIDASETGIQWAKQSHPKRFFLQDITSNTLPPELSVQRFNVLISTEVIEHLYSPREYILFCKNILPFGGRLILSTPYHGYWKNLLLALTGHMDNHFTALWDGGHIKFWSKKTLTKLLTEGGFQVTKFKGVGRMPPLWKSMLVEAKFVP
ncbi:MAG: methyltransferase domain-containing protein [Lewinellaceae bacterium]|nr:methyltransferase domain-containing protein [Lewinellaceae bacterium]